MSEPKKVTKETHPCRYCDGVSHFYTCVDDEDEATPCWFCGGDGIDELYVMAEKLDEIAVKLDGLLGKGGS